MGSIKFRHIVVGLVVFILFLFLRIGDDDYSYEYPEAHTQGAIPTQQYDHSFDNEQSYPYSSTWSHNPSIPTRHEILQTKVKGYREFTYWGSEHPTQEQVQQMNDDEFEKYIEKVEENDVDVYWGAQY